jgi:hypothetical protein
MQMKKDRLGHYELVGDADSRSAPTGIKGRRVAGPPADIQYASIFKMSRTPDGGAVASLEVNTPGKPLRFKTIVSAEDAATIQNEINGWLASGKPKGALKAAQSASMGADVEFFDGPSATPATTTVTTPGTYYPYGSSQYPAGTVIPGQTLPAGTPYPTTPYQQSYPYGTTQPYGTTPTPYGTTPYGTTPPYASNINPATGQPYTGNINPATGMPYQGSGGGHRRHHHKHHRRGGQNQGQYNQGQYGQQNYSIPISGEALAHHAIMGAVWTGIKKTVPRHLHRHLKRAAQAAVAAPTS